MPDKIIIENHVNLQLSDNTDLNVIISINCFDAFGNYKSLELDRTLYDKLDLKKSVSDVINELKNQQCTNIEYFGTKVNRKHYFEKLNLIYSQSNGKGKCIV